MRNLAGLMEEVADREVASWPNITIRPGGGARAVLGERLPAEVAAAS